MPSDPTTHPPELELFGMALLLVRAVLVVIVAVMVVAVGSGGVGGRDGDCCRGDG